MKLKSYATCALLSLFPLASQAVEVGTYQGVKLDLGLQINRALMYADDGITNETFFVDNDNSSTRFSLKAQSNLDDKISVGALFEAEYQSNPSNLVDMETKTTASPTLDERKMEAWISSKEYGRLTIGQGSGAADGNMERELSGTNIINWPNPTLVGGALKFGGTGPTIKSTMSNLDFEGRYDRLRYDTPKFGPISLAVSQGTNKGNDVSEIGARLKTKLDSGIQLDGALGYSYNSGSAYDTKTFGGSFAIAMTNGLNAAVAAGKSSDDNAANPDSKFQSVSVGYKSGKHAVNVLYAVAKDRAMKDDKSTSVGVGYVYHPEKWMDLYAGYKVHSLDRSGTNYDDISTLTTGIRLKF